MGATLPSFPSSISWAHDHNHNHISFNSFLLDPVTLRAGHHVSEFLKVEFPKNLFANPHFATDVPKALRESIALSEKKLLKPPSMGGKGNQCEFSGTTFVATVVRGNTLWVSRGVRVRGVS